MARIPWSLLIASIAEKCNSSPGYSCILKVTDKSYANLPDGIHFELQSFGKSDKDGIALCGEPTVEQASDPVA